MIIRILHTQSGKECAIEGTGANRLEYNMQMTG